MKKVIYGLVLLLVVVSGLVFANRALKKEPAEKASPKPPTAAESNDEMKKWEASPDGIQFKKWEASPIGNKVLSCAAKISDHIHDSTDMEAVVTSLSLPPGSRLGFGLMARIDGEEYIVSFGPESPDNEFQQLHSLKVNDKIIIRSYHVSYAPKYSYPILSGDYVEHYNKVIYKRIPNKGGC